MGTSKCPASSTLHQVLTSDHLFAYSEAERRYIAADAVGLRSSQRCPSVSTPLEADMLRSVYAPLEPLRIAFNFGAVVLLPYDERMCSPVHFYTGGLFVYVSMREQRRPLTLYITAASRFVGGTAQATVTPDMRQTGQAPLAGFFPTQCMILMLMRSAQHITTRALLGTGERTWEDELLHMSMHGRAAHASAYVKLTWNGRKLYLEVNYQVPHQPRPVSTIGSVSDYD